MTKKNVDIVKNFFDAVPKGDITAARSVLGDNIEWIEPDVPELWFTGIHRGADAALREVVEPTFKYVDDFSIMVDEYIDAGDEIIVLGKFLGRGKKTGKNLAIPACFVCRVQNGKIIRFRAYHNTALWLEVLGMYAMGTKTKAA
jgi:ketosteroid isomerase-like protein